MFDLTNPVFHDEDKARAHLEEQRWPNGPECPHCGERHAVTKLEGQKHRKGLYQCNGCRAQFSVTVGPSSSVRVSRCISGCWQRI